MKNDANSSEKKHTGEKQDSEKGTIANHREVKMAEKLEKRTITQFFTSTTSTQNKNNPAE